MWQCWKEKNKKKKGDIAKDKLYTISKVFVGLISDCELQGHYIQLFFSCLKFLIDLQFGCTEYIQNDSDLNFKALDDPLPKLCKTADTKVGSSLRALWWTEKLD